MPKHCEHWYWDVNARHRYRRCKYCGLMQYNYTGVWKDEVKLVGFISNWTPLDGQNFVSRLRIEACQLFEFHTYESWGVAFKVFIGDKEFGPFHNLNQADNALSKVVLEKFPDYKLYMGLSMAAPEVWKVFETEETNNGL